MSAAKNRRGAFAMFHEKKLSFELLDVFKISRKKQTIVTVRKKCHILSYRLSGATDITFQNKTYTVQKDDLLFLPVAASYSQATEGEELIVIHLNIPNYAGSDIKIFRCGEHACIKKYFLLLLKLWNASADNYYRCMTVFYRLMNQISALTQTDAGVDRRLKMGLSLIEENAYRCDFTVSKAEKLSGYSTAYFRKLFKAHFNVTPVKYLNTLRINKSLSLLESGYYNVGEAAVLAGFKDAAYFSMVFKKMMNCTPSEYIKCHARDM